MNIGNVVNSVCDTKHMSVKRKWNYINIDVQRMTWEK